MFGEGNSVASNLCFMSFLSSAISLVSLLWVCWLMFVLGFNLLIHKHIAMLSFVSGANKWYLSFSTKKAMSILRPTRKLASSLEYPWRAFSL
ncbi:unnamed protein product [Amoebophrya sp. A25]|nr:unnamed protein product [Amoebophrya sp. A25]|eukprot:GSA25T00019233001.1